MSGFERFQAISAPPPQQEAAPPVAQGAPAAPQASGFERFQAVGAPAPQPQAQPEGNVLRRAGTWVQNQVTGRDRTEFDYPNLDVDAIAPGGPIQRNVPLTQEQAQGVNTLGRFNFASDDKGRLDILRAARPDIAQTAQTDRFGNIYVNVDGQPQYLNRPGLTGRALASGAASIYSGLPMAGLMASGAGLGTLARTALAALTGGGASVNQDLIAAGGGSQQGIDVPRAGMSALFGAGVELASPAKAAIVRMLRGNPEFATNVGGTINLTEAGRRAFVEAGIDPSTLSNDAMRAFWADARNAANPADAARAASARGLPVTIPLSRGDMTGRPSDQMFESLSEKGAFGQGAETVMRGFRSEQQDAIRGNIPAIQTRLSGGQRPAVGDNMHQAGANIVARLQAMRSADEAAVDAAYTAARATNAELGGAGLSQMISEITNSDRVRPYLANSPRAQSAISQLTDIFNKARNADDLNVPVGNLFQWRRDISKLYGVTTDATEKTALRGVLREFDSQMDNLGTGSLMTGDPAAVQLWREAIGKASAKFQKWDSDTLVSKLADADPLTASNIIFGSKDAGFIKSPELVQGLRQLRRTIPPENWNEIREEAFLRLANKGEGAYQGANRDFSGVNFKKAWDGFMRDNRALARELYSDEEIRLISDFARVSASATGRVRGGDNFSNTTPAAANMVQRLVNLPFMSPRLIAAISQAPGAAQVLGVYATTRAAGAATGAIPQIGGAPVVSGVVGNAITGDQ